MTDKYLYLCSSIRHLYLALGKAMNEASCEHHVIMLGQGQEDKRNPLVRHLAANSGPLTGFYVFKTPAKGSNFAHRKAACAFAWSWAKQLRPNAILGGNDRRVEFQFAMMQARRLDPTVIGVYLDDGSASYVNGRYLQLWRSFTDLTFDHLLKKIFWGLWYHKSLFMGGTKWVDECLLNFPDFAPEPVKKRKKVLFLSPEPYREKAFQDYMLDVMASSLGFNATSPIFRQTYDAFIILPLEKFVEKTYSGIDEYLGIIEKYLSQNNYQNVVIKYHPRESTFYFRSDRLFTEAPAEIPAEIMFSLIKSRCVVGDLSSALLSAAWLLPESKVYCLCPRQLRNNPIMQLVRKTSVEVVMMD